MRQGTWILAGLLILGMTLLPTGASDEFEGNYAISATPGVSLTFCPNDIEFCTGGYIFSADLYDTKPIRVDIADASGGNVDFTVCQDQDENIECGETHEPNTMGCGTTSDLEEDELNEVEFTPDYGTAVFIRLWDPECPDTVATSGTITLTTA